MAIVDRVVGISLLALASIIFSYYFAWTLLTPMLEADNPLQAYFPERKFALVIPAALLVVAFGIGGLFVAAVLIRGAVQKKKSS